MECPLCTQEDGDIPGCYECDDFGYWWIIPTSGHRAYPYWTLRLDLAVDWHLVGIIHTEVPLPPPDWPDHYSLSAAPKGTGLISNLAERLGFVPAPTRITRR